MIAEELRQLKSYAWKQLLLHYYSFSLRLSFAHFSSFFSLPFFSLFSLFLYLRREKCLVKLPKPRNDFLKRAVCYDGAKAWNSLTSDIRLSNILCTLKKTFRLLYLTIFLSVSLFFPLILPFISTPTSFSICKYRNKKQTVT